MLSIVNKSAGNQHSFNLDDKLLIGNIVVSCIIPNYFYKYYDIPAFYEHLARLVYNLAILISLFFMADYKLLKCFYLNSVI